MAARNIKTGDVILQDTALITVSGEADTWEAGQQIHEQVGRMKEEDRKEFYRLTVFDLIIQVLVILHDVDVSTVEVFIETFCGILLECCIIKHKVR